MSSQPTIHNFSHDAMRTRFWLRIADEDAGYAKSASEGLFHFLDDLDFQTEARHDSGPITSINGMPEGALVTASDHVRALWDFSQNLREETGKAFDVSAGKLFKYWEARGDTVPNPDDAEWSRLWADYQEGSFILDGAQFTCVKAGAEIDFGAITRGYALDRMAEMLENNWGIHRALLMAGGSAAPGRLLARWGRDGKWPVDNMEGIALVRRKTGPPIVYLVSDVNFSAAQRTLLLQLDIIAPLR